MAVTAERRAERQLDLLRRSGARTLHAPMPNRATGPVEELAAAIDTLVAQRPEVVVFWTDSGLRDVLDASESLGSHERLRAVLRDARLVARSSIAARAVEAEGWEVSWQAPGGLSEGVTSYLSRLGVEGQRVSILLDEHGSSSLVEQIAALGCGILSVPVDGRKLPDADGPARRLVTEVAECAVDAVTFTSLVGVERFVSLARSAGRIDEVRAAFDGPVLGVSIGPTCTAAIVDAGFGPPIEPAVAQLEDMVDALAHHAMERRRPVLAGDVELLLDATHPVIAGTVIEMGARERAVLDVLADRPGAVVSKVAICRRVWGRSSGLHAVEVTVGRLRDRLDAACGRLLTIDTVPRRGYRLVGASGGNPTQSTARAMWPDSRAMWSE